MYLLFIHRANHIFPLVGIFNTIFDVKIIIDLLKTANLSNILFISPSAICSKMEPAVSASDRTSTSFLRVSLIRNQPVNMPLGPEEAIYCKLHDGLGVTAYEGRGPCQLVLDSVKREHDGYWLMQVGLPGKLSTDFYHIVVTVNDEGKLHNT